MKENKYSLKFVKIMALPNFFSVLATFSFFKHPIIYKCLRLV